VILVHGMVHFLVHGMYMLCTYGTWLMYMVDYRLMVHG
jgi:hypothetical protein